MKSATWLDLFGNKVFGQNYANKSFSSDYSGQGFNKTVIHSRLFDRGDLANFIGYLLHHIARTLASWYNC